MAHLKELASQRLADARTDALGHAIAIAGRLRTAKEPSR
jgi:hypothetical protein